MTDLLIKNSIQQDRLPLKIRTVGVNVSTFAMSGLAPQQF
jgi:hypothetical protein